MTIATDALAFVRAASREAGGGIYLGAGTTGPVRATPERAVLVLGPPRSGKTTSIVIPAILSATGPVVSTSTKPDVMKYTATARARAGECLLYDPSGSVERPAGVAPLVWSPVSACARWDESMLVAQLMNVASTSGASMGGSAGNREGDHWHERAEALLATLLHAASLDGASMATVLKWVDRHQAGPALSILDASGNSLAGDLLGGIATLEQRELSGIWSTASRVLGAYHSEAAMASTTGPSFDAEEWCKGAGTIYICASARHQNLVSPLVVALLVEIRTASYAYDKQIQNGRELGELLPAGPGMRGDSPLFLALDEVANIAPLHDLGQTVSEGGGQGVITLACLQDLSQARSRWGVAADGWLSLFGSKVVMPGIEDVKTLETLSALAGEEEVVTRSISAPAVSQDGGLRTVVNRFSRRGSLPPQAPTVTTSTVRRRRMPVDELSRGKRGMALVVDEHTDMGYVHLTPWFDDDLWRSVVNQGRSTEQQLARRPELPQLPPPGSQTGLDLGR